ncbi:hypothetical protein [Jeongeupia chitinilytica]|nr:hypothetical protein [Jeongeupia chitinilytica]
MSGKFGLDFVGILVSFSARGSNEFVLLCSMNAAGKDIADIRANAFVAN